MKRYINILLLASLFLGCTEEIEIDLDTTYERIVFDGRITNENKQHFVKITRSADYFYNQPAPKITGADVTISDGTNIFTLTESEPGLYLTDSIQGVPGKTYTMEALFDGEIYTASSCMMHCDPIDSITFEAINSEWYKGWLYILIYAQEPADEENFYLWHVYRNDTLMTDTLSEAYFSDDTFINGSYIYGEAVQWVKAEHPDTITLEMHSLNEPYYNFVLEVLLETVWDGGPFDGPPANISTNISNDALGFFTAYAVQRKTAVVPENVPESEW